MTLSHFLAALVVLLLSSVAVCAGAADYEFQPIIFFR